MSSQIAVRLQDMELDAVDREVAEGRAATRSDAVRRAIAYLAREQRYRAEQAVLRDLADRGEPVYPDLEGLLDVPVPPLPDR